VIVSQQRFFFYKGYAMQEPSDDIHTFLGMTASRSVSFCSGPGAVRESAKPKPPDFHSVTTEKPEVSYKEIGGLDEAFEIPLIQHHLYTQIGIDLPRAVLFYGPPGTGKTTMAKAVANAASFINCCRWILRTAPAAS
jgi:Cdc6-like AAA superfamily ATPase